MILFARFRINRLIKKIQSMQKSRLHTQPSAESIKKELMLYQKLIHWYTKLLGHKKHPFAQDMILACLRAASTLDDAASNYQLGKLLLDEAKFKEALQTQGVFDSDVNARQVDALYQEAHAYLLAAQQLQHIEAKRLRGLAIIHGWGVNPDKEQGFDLIVQSINEENSWDRVPQIFASIGLNKPEFFEAMMKKRGQ